MSRKTRSDSAQAAIDAAIAVARPLPEIPRHVRLRDCDQPFWTDILRSRAREEWSQSDLVVAAQLSRCMADIESESEQLEIEGSVLTNERGTKVMNPRHSVLEQLARREMALMRSLQMVGTAKGDKRDVENARKLQRQAEAARGEVTEDDLLAT
jgi:hypothetical protein